MPTPFSGIVCSAPAVRAAFEGRGVWTAWWRVVLWLHGKPRPGAAMTEAARAACVADGFRFYAALYAGLAGAFALAGAALLAVSSYAGGACLLAAAHLAAASSLGRAGAAAYRRGEKAGTLWLVVFLAAVTGFLCAFLAAASVWADRAGAVPPAVNLAATAALLAFGVGSYAIELVYLITCGRRSA